MRATRVGSPALLLALVAGGFGVPAASAQRAACSPPVASPASRDKTSPDKLEPVDSWPPPLDTRITLHAHDLSLRDALDRVSAQSGVRIVYSSELLPLDRRSCIDADNSPLGQILTALLAGSGAEATVVAGSAVLAPRTGLAPDPSEMAHEVGNLERVLVTGSAVATPRRALTIGVDVIDGTRLRRESRTTLAEILDAGAPGVWAWERSPSSLVTQYGSIRGASSFTSSYPKIYIDGVEVANPLLVTELDPDVIDHIEVIRGPQGSALYGSDAISGVINVVSRHDGAESGGASLRLSSTAGASAMYGAGAVPTHEQRIAYRGGSNLFTNGLSLVFGQTGQATPASATSHLLVAGDTRYVGTGATVAVTARYMHKRADVGVNPLLVGLLDPVASTQSTPQSVQQYTLGASTIVNGGGRWTHTALVGLDGYSLSHLSDTAGPFPLGVDSALRAAEGTGERVTLRASTTGRFGDDGGVLPATITFGIEQAVLRQRGLVSTPTMGPGGKMEYPDAPLESWNHNTGIFSQFSTAWHNSLFVTGGLRVERNDAFSGDERYPLLPMLGIAVVRDIGPFGLKLRSAYGKGIRPPQTPARTATVMQRGDWRVGLDPESQSGIENGAELYLGRTFALQVTRFDQVASGLIQNVTVAVDTQTHNGVLYRHVRYQLQNVGAISNHGWEMQATLQHGSLALASALTLVDSRVRTVAADYNGDLRAGDRMLGVPARTTSLTASWTGGRAFAALSATRASDWIDYDRLSLASAYMPPTTGGAPNLAFVGSELRKYWITYTGQTRLRLSTSLRLRSGIEATLTGDNLLGGQTDEPDNLTIRAGRTIMGGMRATF
jgi:iron complex outermembrane receptor protein